jgi:formate dehydrogenase iron-sulfur subunit
MNIRGDVAPSQQADVRPGLLEGMTIAPPPPEHEPMGFFTDTTLCIGCKACEVACKQWNALPADGLEWTGRSYDNTTHLSATTWRHVSFTEQVLPGGGARWLFNSDVCKHCTAAPCQARHGSSTGSARRAAHSAR